MIALYIVCAATVIAFAIQQTSVLFTTKENRLFPFGFLYSRILVLMFICTCCPAGALYITVYNLPLYSQFVGGDNGVEAAVQLLPFICFYIFFVVLGGFLMLRWGYYIPWFLVSGVFTTIRGTLLYTSSTILPYANIYGYCILVGIGMTVYQAPYSVVPSKVPEDQIAEALQFINAGQQGSTMIALTVGNTIYQNVAYHKLLPILVLAGYFNVDLTAAIAGAMSDVLQSAPAGVKNAALGVSIEAPGLSTMLTRLQSFLELC